MKKTILCLIILSVLADLRAEAVIINPIQKKTAAFAIFVDSTTNARIGKAILDYRNAVEYDGLSAYIIADNWRSPDEIKAVIIRLYKAMPPLEGVVFIGDIPIPMIRDAQHLTSAFKMDQERYNFQRSSIPSDRFYDDFDLKFDFLKQDTTDHLLFYYSLRADCPQKIEREIYSARIFPSVKNDSKYILIEKYLKRVVNQKRETNRLDNVMTFTGHGYHSEALDAWNNNLTALREQFPSLSEPGGRLTNLSHGMSKNMKDIVLGELQKPELDMAIFHAHGDYDTQYLIGYPPAENINDNVDAIKLFVRSKMRDARDRKQSIDEVKSYYQSAYNLPDTWFAGAFDDSISCADSLYSANLDLYSCDVTKLAPQAEVVIFDECFNGCFIKPDYVAGTYIFGNGTTVAGIANTVNVKQDIWSDEFLGLLAYDWRIGEWHKMRTYLESHLFGDPTFHFNSLKNNITAFHKLQTNPHDLRVWQKELKSTEPLCRMLAVRQILNIQGLACEPELIRIYRTDPSWNVRLEVLKSLAALRTPGFENLLTESINDPFELIRRFSVSLMGVVGKDEYLPYLADKTIFDVSERVAYTAKSAIEKIDPLQARKACVDAISKLPSSERNEHLLEIYRNSFSRSDDWLNNELLINIKNDTLKVKARIDAARSFRNYQFKGAISDLISVSADSGTVPEVRVAILEALGWFSFSINRNLIADHCDQIIRQPNLPENVRHEAQKTRRRIKDGINDSLNP